MLGGLFWLSAGKQYWLEVGNLGCYDNALTLGSMDF